MVSAHLDLDPAQLKVVLGDKDLVHLAQDKIAATLHFLLFKGYKDMWQPHWGCLRLVQKTT